MADLFVVDNRCKHRFRRTIPEQTPIRIGRAPRDGWNVPWDLAISREHVDLLLVGDTLQVKRLRTSRNPVFFRGEPCDEFEMQPGEEFQISDTVFRFLVIQFDSGLDANVAESSYSGEALLNAEFSHPDLKLEMLSRLPKLICEARSDRDLATTIVEQLLEAIPGAAVVSVIQNHDSGELWQNDPAVVFWDSRCDTRSFRPSRKLLARAAELRESVLHVWGQDLVAGESQFSRDQDFAWAFCVPARGECSTDWCIYVTGFAKTALLAESSRADLRGDMRFVEILAEFIRAVRTVRVLERQHVQMGQFFSPAVVETLMTTESEELLQPRTQDATVLFCDLRGFSQQVEQAHASLYPLLCRVSEALGVMTQSIMKFEGVIADFQGDAALGFWGWPRFSPEDPLSACRAALAMLFAFRQADGEPDNPLASFQVGIGICHGNAVAGKIGTSEQAKVGVFGPVVNLAARLESLTKRCGVPILIDEATASHVRAHLADEARCRRIAQVRPVGFRSAVMVSELMPASGASERASESKILNYERALDAFIEGQWQEAGHWLDGVPDDDGAKQFLSQFLATHQWQPPQGWDGVIALHEK